MMRSRAKRRLCLYLIAGCTVCSFMWLIMVFRSPNSTDVDKNKDHPDDQPVLIKVVEEHHEVVPHWIREIKESPREKYTIVHIDAHPDNAMPEMMTDFPLWRLPNDFYEEKTLMQANDRFIISTAMTGKIERVVWIYPYWVSTDIYQDSNFSMGIHSKGKNFCYCESSLDKKFCGIMDYDMKSEDDFTKEVHSNSCSPNVTIFYEQCKDIYSQTRLLSEKKWIPKTPLILDIDEDFFGVELPTQSLAPAGLSLAQLKPLQGNIRKLFCPTIISMETVVNQWFSNIISTLSKARCDDKSKPRLSPFCNFDHAYQKFYVDFRLTPIGGKMFCRRKLSYKVDVEGLKLFTDIYEFLIRLNATQLKTLGNFGLCLQNSLIAYNNERNHFGLCFGSNFVNDSMVDEHILRTEELVQQLERVDSIVSLLPQPRLITIARSSRDGYVPRQWQQKIEDGLLKILFKHLKLTDKNVVYDDYLFGGVKGWASLVDQSIS